MIVRAKSVTTLWRMLLSRNRKIAMSVGIAIGVLVALEVMRHGVRIDSILAWALGGSGMLAFAPSLGLVREKADGSLRFLAFLPIHGEEHALARALTALSLSLPTALLLAFGLPSLLPGVPTVVAVGAGVSLWLTLAVASLLFTALQLRSAIGRGMIGAIYAFVAFAVLAQVASALADRAWFRAVGDALASQAGIAAASALVWVIIFAVGAFALRLIALESPRYRGEPAER